MITSNIKKANVENNKIELPHAFRLKGDTQVVLFLTERSGVVLVESLMGPPRKLGCYYSDSFITFRNSNVWEPLNNEIIELTFKI